MSKDDFIFIPYYSTLKNEEIYSVPGEYIFSGGNSDRDYHTLVHAIKGLGTKTVIATNSTSWITPDIQELSDLDIRPMHYEEYTRHMKESLINVVVIKEGLLRSAGQQTFINSMLLGKPTIICDNGECLDYIREGIDAIHVASGDIKHLRRAISNLLSDKALRESLGVAAKSRALLFSNEKTMAQVLQLGENLAQSRNISAEA